MFSHASTLAPDGPILRPLTSNSSRFFIITKAGTRLATLSPSLLVSNASWVCSPLMSAIPRKSCFSECNPCRALASELFESGPSLLELRSSTVSALSLSNGTRDCSFESPSLFMLSLRLFICPDEKRGAAANEEPSDCGSKSKLLELRSRASACSFNIKLVKPSGSLPSKFLLPVAREGVGGVVWGNLVRKLSPTSLAVGER
mmetsp:Transcript_39880/g.106544  ORF Transcript_39880/g.106544 Transcript_39880/m.106544 type:complete len:202 (-) Transcript_39880:167-772(-)